VILAEKWFSTQRWRYPSAIGILFFLCFWTKLVYLWLLPGLGCILLLSLLQHRSIALKNRRRILQMILQSAWCVGIFLLPSATLLLSSEPGHPHIHPLLDQLRNGSMYSMKETLQYFWTLPVIVRMANPLEAAHRIVDLGTIGPLMHSYDVLLFFLIPCTLLLEGTLYLFYRSRKKKKEFTPWAKLVRVTQSTWLMIGNARYTATVVHVLAFALTVGIIARTRSSASMHHIILAYPFLILSFLELRKALFAHVPWGVPAPFARGIAMAWLLTFTAMNGIAIERVLDRPIQLASDSSRIPLNRMLKDPLLAQSTLTVVLDWGMYYYQGLYGDSRQAVLYMEPLRESERMEQLRSIAHASGRKIVFVWNQNAPSSDMDQIARTFLLTRCTGIPENSVWQAWAEEGLSHDSKCFQANHATEPSLRSIVAQLLDTKE
jgi:hypothetical protein